MAPIKPNQNKLIVTGKNKKASDYATDMRTIEQWANARHLQAGSGITIINPDAPNPTISASGGGATVLGHCTLSSGPDFAQINSQAVFLGPTDEVNLYFSYLDVQSTGGSGVFNTMASSWIVAVIGGQSIDLFPAFSAPAYSSGLVSVEFQMQAWAINETNVAIYTAGPINVASGATYQSVAADFTLVHNAGGDLSLVPGAGVTGVGLVSAAGGFYIASITCTVIVSAGTTFT